MTSSHFILAFAWILYCLLHSLLASLGFKKRLQHFSPGFFKRYRLFYSVFAFLGLIAILLYLVFLPSSFLFAPSLITRVAGGIVAGCGLVVMIICISKYFFQLSGLKALLHEQKKNELMITGIHKKIRHPLYAGTFVFIWGLLIFYPVLSLFISDIIITAYTLIGIRLEEQKLENEFGEAYRQYRRDVPMIIPRLKR
jgi:protein-S-isoprenylcysteine O-methyltransferase Ste14